VNTTSTAPKLEGFVSQWWTKAEHETYEATAERISILFAPVQVKTEGIFAKATVSPKIIQIRFSTFFSKERCR
jgi:hypothetical protein